jgi:hypothetical protein
MAVGTCWQVPVILSKVLIFTYRYPWKVQSYKLEFLLKLNIPNPLAGTYRGRKDLLKSGRYLPTGAKCHLLVHP